MTTYAHRGNHQAHQACEPLMAEAAFAIANHGFAEDEFGTSEGSQGNNIFVRLNHVTLLNVGEDALAERVRTEVGDSITFEVWATVGATGYRAARFWPEGPDSDVAREFERARDEHDEDNDEEVFI